MTATITALIELAVQHGFGVALLIIGGQIALDRLMPVEHLWGFVLGLRHGRSTGGAHRRESHRLARCPE